MKNNVSSEYEVHMKKLLIIAFAIFATNLQSFALTPQETTSQEYIENHGGYSSEMARLVDLQRAQFNNTDPKYVKPKEHWETFRYPRFCTEKRVRYIRNVFEYLDPSIDQGKFGTKDVKPTSNYEDL